MSEQEQKHTHTSAKKHLHELMAMLAILEQCDIENLSPHHHQAYITLCREKARYIAAGTSI